MNMIFKNFGGSLLFAIICLFAAGLLGYANSGSTGLALSYIMLALILGIMETSLSLDNAVVNATILKDMDPVWQQRFLTWGVAIAVFGMRIVFPIAIVSIAGWITPWEAINVAITDKEGYERIVTGAHEGIAGFGGAFLLMVGLTFFFSSEKEHHWLGGVERSLSNFSKNENMSYFIGIILLGITTVFAQSPQTFGLAAVSGIITYWGVGKIGDMLGEPDATGAIKRTGAASFIYLEFLDASFSFDGVIGAFAITNDIFLIALGLGIGAMFVRSMTIFLVRGGHMSVYRYLEHGAFWAILALAFIMLMSVRVHIPEIITGLIGALLIGAAWRTSVTHRKAHPEEYVEDDDGEAVSPSGEVIGVAR